MNRFKKWLMPVAIVCLLLASLVGCSQAPASLGQIFDPSGNPFANRFSDVTDLRTATFVVAASDSVHKFEADYKCNGTNDHVQVQAAIDSLPATGGEVFLLDGTYNIEVSIALDSFQTLRGTGFNTILTTTTAAVDIITATGGDGSEKVEILVADLCVNGTAGGVDNDVPILWEYVDNSKIVNTWIRDNAERGIYLSYCDFNVIADNICQANTGSSIEFFRSNNNTVTGNTCHANTVAGIYLYESSNNTVVGNTSQGNTGTGSGIKVVTTSNNNTITGNTCQGNGYHGVGLGYSANNNTITGNTCQGNGYEGIYIDDSDNNTISGNTCQGNGDSGICIGESSNNTIIGNTCQGNAWNGIAVDISDSNAIVGNTCLENSQETDNTHANIWLKDSDYNLVEGNVCRQGVLANQPSYGIDVSNDACDRNCLIGNDLYDSGKTGDLNDVAVTNPTLKHDNRDLAGTGWLPEV